MIVEPTLVELPKPTNEDDDIRDMYSKWIHHHMTFAVDSSPNPLPKHYKDVLKLSKQEQELWTASMKEEIKPFTRERYGNWWTYQRVVNLSKGDGYLL